MATTTNHTKGVALITGGSSGIGLAIAHELALKGYSLLLVSNQKEALLDCQIEIEKLFGVKCFTLFIDLVNSEAAQQIFAYCNSQNLEIEVLVNNAGMLIFSEAVETAPQKINAVLQLHVLTPTMLCRLFGNEMKRSKRGYILNVSSISCVMPYPGISIYGPSKTYLKYYTRALRSELKMYGVYVTTLIPGATATALYDQYKVDINRAMQTGIMKPAEYVASKAINALFENKAICIPGMLNKIMVMIAPLIPSWLIMFLYRKTSLMHRAKEMLG